MEYNTTRPKVYLKEYGRHVQQIVEKCIIEPDEEKRNQFAREIIDLMGQLNPQLRNVEDFKHKLWDHLFVISDYNLVAESPYPIRKREDAERKPDRLPYPQSRIKYRHYGKNVTKLIAKAVDTTDEEKQAAFTSCIGNFMKLVYQNWSQENVNDEIIKNDLNMMSEGQLTVADDSDLNSLARSNKFKPGRNDMNGGSRNKPGGKFRHNGGNRNKNFKKRR